MSTQRHAAKLAVLALGFSVAPYASAALWSSTNTVTGITEMATMEISLTGDQVTVAADIEIAIPTGIANVTVTPLNGAGCAYLASLRVVRVLIDDPMLRPLPVWARPMCTIQYRNLRSTNAWFLMRGAFCFMGDGTPVPSSQCVRDQGYLTVRR